MYTLNEAYSSVSVRRRYEVWFLRVRLADGSGAWWFRYLLLNPGRSGCSSIPGQGPVQVWATWFPTGNKPKTYIQCFPLSSLALSRGGQSPFSLHTGEGEIDENSCRGVLNVEGHSITWNLQYRSTFRVTLSHKGWIGFSCTPHSDAVFSGEITLDGRKFSGDSLGFGVQGHNCGYRHRDFWAWTHAYFPAHAARPSTLEALTYNMPFGMTFRKVVLWHEGVQHVFRGFQNASVSPDPMFWRFACRKKDMVLRAEISGSGPSLHRLPYAKTNCSGTFEVLNNSLASGSIQIQRPDSRVEQLETATGAVLEIGGNYPF